MLTFNPVKVDTSSGDEDGQLVFMDGYLIGVVVELADKSHGAETGRWHFEAVFDSVAAPTRTFTNLDEISSWLLERFTSRIR